MTIFDLWKFITQLRYVTDSVAESLLLAIVVLIILFIVGIWFKGYQLAKITVFCVAMSVPIVTGILLLIPNAFRGTLDFNCAKYGGGKTVFVLENVVIRPILPSAPYGETVLILLVRSSGRWGEDLHTCAISRENEKAKNIINQLFGPLGPAYTPGVTTFVFGNEWETPNIVFEPKVASPEKPYPPEVSSNNQLNLDSSS